MPAVLLELGFMDSRTDVPVILTEEFADRCAGAIVKVLVQRGGLRPREEQKKQVELTLPALQKGDSGKTVQAAQNLLLAAGIPLEHYGADGDFGSETEKGLLRFQQAKALVVTGRVDEDTWKALLGL